ncbi:glycosyltransferase family 2 protein [Botrimarina hoheduenensis]|uniref:Undecaprenyl-phosphate mannosyltransferase n=1 Tax=Botrimarina hoheduenensis TaxID=2528000 RepID=A0A5C5WDJ9_9BACT|nr:glycosyltransferase family 2 protein [Botrimarina hoheduenensis]TWT48710.1 Undecaprenyl-phosphate mannosyltransferase [Botrimarina hoheduenensis]
MSHPLDESVGLLDQPRPQFEASSHEVKPTVRLALPAYNEAESLEMLLESLHRTLAAAEIPHEIVVVDDGSSDETAQIASAASFRLPVRLVRHEKNQGLAAALRTGFIDAVEHSAPEDIIITMDSDNTHPAGLMPRMIQMIGEGHDVVIASRFQSGARVIGVPFDRVLLSIAARILFKVAFPIRGVRDYTCGYRAYRAGMLAAAINHYGDRFVSEKGFSCMVDVLLKLRRLRIDGGPIVMGEAPMILRYDLKGGVSKMRVLRTIGQTLSLILRRRVGGA